MKVKNEISAGGIVYKKIYHLGSMIYDLQWLICQHSQHKGWVFPKGLIGDHAKDEPMEQAALREVEEEGGIKAKIIDKNPVKVAYSYKWENLFVKKTVYYFLMKYLSGNPKNHDWEMMDARFVTKKEVKKILTYSSDKEAFKKILKTFVK
ncbi:NUDIX domain-containing protein [Candidatus Roizmanbacteria bacterium]|nr:NUDIX domain-containing protein [Candidatus Roizmanbacteria bacterium]